MMSCFLPRACFVLLASLIVVLPGATVSAETTSDAATRQYAAAVALQNRGVFDLAAAEWVKFIETHKTHPRTPNALLHLGVCYLKTEKLEQAVQSFETLIKTYDDSELQEAAHFYLGVAQYTLGQQGTAEMYDAAAASFEQLLETFPESRHGPQAVFYRGESLYARGKREPAAAMYSRLIEEHPESDLIAEAMYALGVAQEELNQPAEAGKTYDTFLEKFKKHPLRTEVIMRRGEVLFTQKQYGPAAQWLAVAAGREGFALADHATMRQAAALAMQKKYAEAAALYGTVPAKFPQSRLAEAARLEGGKCRYLAGELDKAREALRPVVEGGGAAAAEAAHWTARAFLRENNPAEALEVVEAVLPGAGESPFLARLLMDQADAVYEIADRRSESVGLYAALAEKHPEDAAAPQALYMAAFAALGQTDYQAAQKYADAFLQKYPEDELAADVCHVAAESALQLKQHADAEQFFARALKRNPNHPDAEVWKVRRGLALHLQGQFQQTIDALAPFVAELNSPPLVAEAQHLLGSSHAELGQFEPAIKALEAALGAHAKWRQADETLLVLAHAYSRSGKLQEAAAAARRLMDEFPQSRLMDQAHYRLAEYSYATGDFQKAAAQYQLVLDNHAGSPLRPHALYGLGWSRLSRAQYEAAENAFNELVAEFPNDNLIPRARYARGMARQQLGKFAPAAEDVQALLAAEPAPAERSDARYVLGLCQVGLKQYPEAVSTFRALLDDDPDYGNADKALYELAWALKSQEKEAEAAEAFAQLVGRFPDSPLASEGHYHVGEEKYRNGDFAAAVEAYQASMAAAQDAPLGEKAAHKLGWAFFRQERLEDARKTFAHQRATWPEGPLAPDAAFMEAEVLFSQDKYEEALAGYEAVENPSTKEFKTLTLLHAGQSAAQLKQWEKALETLDKLIDEFPDSSHLPEALYEKGWALQNVGREDEALAAYEQVIAATDREAAARAQFMIGEIQFEQKEHREAIVSFFKVISGYGYPKWQAYATYEAARCFEALGHTSQAIQQYQELLKNYPDSEQAPLAKQRLAALGGQ